MGIQNRLKCLLSCSSPFAYMNEGTKGPNERRHMGPVHLARRTPRMLQPQKYIGWVYNNLFQECDLWITWRVPTSYIGSMAESWMYLHTLSYWLYITMLQQQGTHGKFPFYRKGAQRDSVTCPRLLVNTWCGPNQKPGRSRVRHSFPPSTLDWGRQVEGWGQVG